MKLVKFTNTLDGLVGNPLYLNVDWIVAVHETNLYANENLKTVIYGGPQGTTWEVAEGPEEVLEIIRNATQ